MTLQELKTGLFGYQKAGVYQYITELEEQFSAQMLEREKRIQQYEGRIAELEQHLKTLQAREREASPATSPDRPELQEMEVQAAEAQRRLEERVADQDRALARYDQQLRQLRQLFHDMLLEMDGTAEQLEGHLESTKAAGRDRNMSLFRRKHTPET